jgi:hypothetical protein
MTHIEKIEKLLPEVVALGREEFPYFKAYISKLGGSDRATILISLSMDEQTDWANGILENSGYSKIYISRGRKKYFEIEQFSKGLLVPRLRKSSTDDLIPKLRVVFKKLNENYYTKK